VAITTLQVWKIALSRKRAFLSPSMLYLDRWLGIGPDLLGQTVKGETTLRFPKDHVDGTRDGAPSIVSIICW
jgi:hypothetical protein